MTKKGIILNVCGIILLMLVFLLSSCSQAALTGQDTTKSDLKITDSVKAGRVIRESANKMYYVIPTIMQDNQGWDWCACTEISMAFIDPNCGFIDQSELFPYGPYASLPLYNASSCIWANYKRFKGQSTFVPNYGCPSLSFLKTCYDCGHIWINERIERVPPFKRYTVIIYGYDMNNRQIAYFNPATGFCGWVNYSTFITSYSENGSPSSFSNDMLAVFPRVD
jgi:hypothetical protein